MKLFCQRFPILMLVLASIIGCSSSAGNENQARAALKQKLDGWVSGDKEDHLIMPFELALVDPPTSYEIKSFISTDKGASKSGSFLVSVSLDFKNRAGSTSQRVLRYEVYKNDKTGTWRVVEESQKVFDHG